MAVWISNFSVYETSYNVEANTSQVRFLLQATSDGSWNSDPTYGWARIDWNTVAEYSPSFESGETITLCDITRTIAHNADGAKTIYADYAWDTGLTSTGTLSGGSNIALTTIPRGSKLGNIAAFDVESTITVPITKYASSFTDKLTIKIGDTVIKTINNVSNGYLLTFSASELNSIYELMSSVNSTAFTFLLESYSGTTLIGSDIKTISASITNANPTLSDITISEGVAGIATLTNDRYILKHSTVVVSIPQAQSFKGASITHFNINGTDYAAPNSYPLVVNLMEYNASSVVVYAIDSRSNSVSVTKQPALLDYTDLVAASQCAKRSQNGIGSGVTVSINGSWWDGNFYNTNNGLECTYRYKKTSENSWTNGTTTITPDVSQSGKYKLTNVAIAGDLGADGFDTNYAYNIEVIVSDTLNNISGVTSQVPFPILLSAGVPAIKIQGNTVSHINLSTNAVRELADYFYPVGSVYLSFESTSPASIFGGTWTQITDRFLYAANSSGVTGGESEHTLTRNEMPDHAHDVGTNGTGGFAGWYSNANPTYSDAANSYPTLSAGGSQAHNNMPPYITCYTWRRTE